MKKFYLTLLASAAVFGAYAATPEEPTLELQWSKIYTENCGDKWDGTTPNWSTPEAIKAQPCTRVGTAINGKFYAVNMKTMSIMEFDQEGNRDKYTLPSLAGEEITYYATDANHTETTIPDYYGTLITRDDAGNFIIGHGFVTGAMSNYFTIYNPESGKAKRFEVEYPTSKTGINCRIDALGRAIGDVMNDGFLWVAPTSIYWANIKPYQTSWATADNVQYTKMLWFNGDGEDIENTELDAYVAGTSVYLGAHISTTFQPIYENVDDVLDAIEAADGKDADALQQSAFMWSKACGEDYAKNIYCIQAGIQNLGSSALTAPFAYKNGEEYTDIATNYGGYSFDTFVLGDQRYFVTNYNKDKDSYDACHNPMDIAVYNEAGELVATWSNINNWKTNLGYSTITCEKIDEENARIHVYNVTTSLEQTQDQAVGCAVLTFSIGDGGAGISDIVLDETEAPAVYYNLQGVEIANPENGIFVVRRGNKVSKEIR